MIDYKPISGKIVIMMFVYTSWIFLVRLCDLCTNCLNLPSSNPHSQREASQDSDDDDNSVTEVDVYPQQFGERFLLRLCDFRLKLQVNLQDEGHGNKMCNVRCS